MWLLNVVFPSYGGFGFVFNFAFQPFVKVCFNIGGRMIDWSETDFFFILYFFARPAQMGRCNVFHVQMGSAAISVLAVGWRKASVKLQQ